MLVSPTCPRRPSSSAVGSAAWERVGAVAARLALGGAHGLPRVYFGSPCVITRLPLPCALAFWVGGCLRSVWAAALPLIWVLSCLQNTLNPADPEVPSPPGTPLCADLLVFWSPLSSPPLLAETPDPTPFSLVPTDGLVKRLEELERTAELYKGGQRPAGVSEACSQDGGVG